MVTDWEPYAEFALEHLQNTPGLKNRFEGFAPHQEWRPETKFENKGLNANREIKELFFEKKS
jgi:tRNA (guanine-N7-)-methyltransferase